MDFSITTNNHQYLNWYALILPQIKFNITNDKH